jgi:hypothetical protein
MGQPLDQVAVRLHPGQVWDLLFPSSFAPKEFAQYGRALIGEHSWDYFRLMVQPGMVQNVQDGTPCSCLGVRRAEHQALQSRLHDGACAHRAGLNCSIQVATLHPVVTQLLRGPAQRQNLRVRGRVMQMDGAIVGARQHASSRNEYGSHGDFSLTGSALRFSQRHAHKALVL